MKKILTIIILFITVMSCQSSRYMTTLSNDEFAKHIDLEYRKKLFFIDLYVNGIPTKFLVDTGASITVVDINQAYKFKFICISNGKKLITGLKGEVLEYRIKNIIVTTIDNKYLPFYFRGCDLSHVVKTMNKDGINISGILGSDFLMNSNAVINYQDKTLDLFNY